MATNRNEGDIARLGVETRKITMAARASCEESAEHVKSSRSAIARSLSLLGKGFYRVVD